jgi:hypothetical protein
VGRDYLAGLAPREMERPVEDLAVGAICKAGRREFAKSGAECKPPLINLPKRHILPVTTADLMPGGLAPEEYLKAFMGEFGLRPGQSMVHELPGGIPVVINRMLFTHKAAGKLKITKSGRERYIKLLARTIKSPYEIWQVPAAAAGRKYTTLRLLRLFSWQGSVGGFSVFNLVGGRWLGATAFTPKLGRPAALFNYLERQRVGALVYREP